MRAARPHAPAGLLLASGAGMVENAAVLRDAGRGDPRLVGDRLKLRGGGTPVGFFAFRERLVANRVAGIGLVLGGLGFLALAPT